MKKFKVGERYKVNNHVIEKGNVIEITKLKGNNVYYKTIEGEAPHREWFERDSLFARDLEPVHSNETAFKVGDKVRVKRFKNRPTNWNLEGLMDHLMGKIVEIKEISGFDYIKIYDNVNHRNWVLNFNQFEPVKTECIVIYRKDNQMIALDKSTGEKAIAKCSPQDTFDYKLGAKLAFSRLMGEEEDKASGNFKVLCVENAYLGSDLVFKKGELYEYVNGSCLREDNHKSGNYKNFAELIKHNICYKGKLFEVKEVKRRANPGEYVKVVNSSCVPTTNRKPDYKNGDILKIINYGYHARYGYGTGDNGLDRLIVENEYVVLEGDYPKEDPINVGDTVKVVDAGRVYDTYYNWSGLCGYTNNFIKRGTPDKDKKYKVLRLGKHDSSNSELALIQNPNTTQVFIINVEGLEKC